MKALFNLLKQMMFKNVPVIINWRKKMSRFFKFE
jgi:hypothetical protein